MPNIPSSTSTKKPSPSAVKSASDSIRSVDFCRFHRKHLLRVRAPRRFFFFIFIFFLRDRKSNKVQQSKAEQKGERNPKESLIAQNWIPEHVETSLRGRLTVVIANHQIEVKKSVRNAPDTLPPMQSTICSIRQEIIGKNKQTLHLIYCDRRAATHSLNRCARLHVSRVFGNI